MRSERGWRPARIGDSMCALVTDGQLRDLFGKHYLLIFGIEENVGGDTYPKDDS